MGVGLTPQVQPALPAAVATSVACYGDSQLAGSEDNKPSVTPMLTNVGNNATGGARQALLLEAYRRGIVLPTTWFKGGVGGTSPNMPTGQSDHECHSGESATQIATAFAGRFAAHPAQAIILLTGAVDLFNGISGGDTDAQAAAAANGAIAGCLAAIKAAAPTVPVLLCSPLCGQTIVAAGLLLLPLLVATVASAAAGGQKVWVVDLTTTTQGNGTSDLFADTGVNPAVFALDIAGPLILRALMACPY